MCCFTKLAKAAEQNKDAIKSVHDEITNYCHQMQSKMVKLASVCGLRDSLEKQLKDVLKGSTAHLVKEDHMVNKEQVPVGSHPIERSVKVAGIRITTSELSGKTNSVKKKRGCKQDAELMTCAISLELKVAAFVPGQAHTCDQMSTTEPVRRILIQIGGRESAQKDHHMIFWPKHNECIFSYFPSQRKHKGTKKRLFYAYFGDFLPLFVQHNVDSY